MTESKRGGKKPLYIYIYIHTYKSCLPDSMSFPTTFTYSKFWTPRVL